MNQTDVVTEAVRRSKTRTVTPATKQKGATGASKMYRTITKYHLWDPFW